MAVGNNDIVRGVLSMTMANGDVAKNVFTWQVDKVSVGNWTDSVAGGHMTDAIEDIFDELLSRIKSTVSFDTVDCYKYVNGEWVYFATKTPSITPTNTFDILPAGVSMLMTGYTAYNRVFGRKFIYGVCEPEVSATGELVSAALTDLADAALVYISNYNGGTMGPLDYLVPGVYSSKASGFVPFGAVAVVKSILSYQRRRKSGVGV